MPRIFVIIPAYNENEVLRMTIEEFSTFNYTIIVVDDGSYISQASFLTGLPVTILRHKINLGQGASLQTGNEYALKQGADFIVHFDADGQHSVHDIQDLLAPLFTNKFDIALGSRFLSTSNKIPLGKKILLKSARYINFLFSGILLSDAHNGLRAMTAAAISKIRIKENRMAHASEILLAITKNKLRYLEIPVTVKYTAYSKEKGQSAFNSIRIFFDLLLHKLFE